MPDYKQLYLTLFRANEAAAQLLLDAQTHAEEAILSADEPALRLLPSQEGTDRDGSAREPKE